MEYHFVYITTNLRTKKSYVGSHSAKNLEDSYLGSGILIKKSIIKYGKEKFQRRILEIFPLREEAVNKEEFYIKKYQTLVPNGYNISEFGNAAFPGFKNPMYGKDPWNKGIKMSENFCLKMKENALGNNWRLGKSHSEKTKKKIGEKHKGNTYRLGKKVTEEGRKVLSDSHKGQTPWNKGKKGISEETRNKMRKAKIGKNPFENMPIGICKYCEAKMKLSHLNRYHNNNCKLKP